MSNETNQEQNILINLGRLNLLKGLDIVLIHPIFASEIIVGNGANVTLSQQISTEEFTVRNGANVILPTNSTVYADNITIEAGATLISADANGTQQDLLYFPHTFLGQGQGQIHTDNNGYFTYQANIIGDTNSDYDTE